MNRTQRGVTLNLVGSIGSLAFGVEGMFGEYGSAAAVPSPLWGIVFSASVLLLGFGTYLQLTGARLHDRSDFLSFPRPGDFRRRKIRRPTDVN